VLTELATALIGFLAGLADFSVGAGFDALAVPSLILIGVDPQMAIAEGLFAQVVSSTFFGVIKRRVILSRSGLVVIAASSSSALALSLLSLSLNRAVVEAAVGSVLLMLSSVLVLKIVGSSTTVSDPPVGEGRLAALALGAGAVKGLAGSGMSAVMMLGQLVMGVGMGRAVVMAVVSKSIPATAALLPRALGGGLDIVGAVALAVGAIASITVAERVRAVLSPKLLGSVLCCYSAAVGSYLVLKAAGIV